jgi:hypothetical protein
MTIDKKKWLITQEKEKSKKLKEEKVLLLIDISV